MKPKYRILFFFTLVLLVSKSTAQQDAQYTQYMYNTISVNPAYAGSREALSAIILHRSQWVGLEGAPTTQAFSVNSPIDFNQKIGLGLSFFNEKIGSTKETSIDVDVSYNINLTYHTKLFFGMKIGGHLLDINFDDLLVYNQNDALLPENVDTKFSPNIGAGLYLQSQKYYIGISVPNFLETKFFEANALSSGNVSNGFVGRERMSYFLMGGYVFDLSPNLKFKPAFLSKMVLGAPLQLDFSANMLVHEKFSIGAAYRWSAGFSALTGYQLSDSIFVGLAYDREVTELGNTQFNSGSFEAILRFELRKKAKRFLTPRFF